MKRFTSINYTRITCTKCGAATAVEPGTLFDGLNCECNKEIATPEKEIKVYTNTQGDKYELLGRFKDGDVELKSVDGSLTYRVRKQVFDDEYKPYSKKVALTLADLQGKTEDEIREEYTVEELRYLARAHKLRGYSQMNEQKLIGQLIERLEN